MKPHQKDAALRARRISSWIAPAAALIVIAPVAAHAGTSDCESLAGLSLTDTTIATAQTIPAGSFTPPGGTALAGLPEFCRVAGSIHPTSDSDIGFEVWMPTTTWNGRYGQIGNGGFAGSIPFTSMGPAVVRGFATAGTDDGHTGSGLDGSWALGHPEKLIDYGNRAVHLTSVISQQVVAAFYQQDANYSYFVGCSDGGREGMVEFQRYPDDFDGWVVGAPAYAQSRLLSGFVWDEQAINATPASALTADKLQLLTNAVLARCDAQDGIADGVVADPRRCHFDPGVLQCTGADAPTCLTADQVTAVRKIYAGPSNPRNGVQIYPGFERGAESNPLDWPLWITNPDGTGTTSYQLAFGAGAFKYFVFNDPNYDYRSFNFASDFRLVQQKIDPVGSAYNPNLRRIRAAGKKIIHYHGWADTALTPRGSIDYYRAVAAVLGGARPASGVSAVAAFIELSQLLDAGRPRDEPELALLADFYRLFMAPGMAHCGGGPGPNAFGQNYALNALSLDPQHDVVQAIVDWVENGTAPDRIIATKYNNDVVGAGNVVRTRPLCPYPQVAKYAGDGSTDDAANFSCVPPSEAGTP